MNQTAQIAQDLLAEDSPLMLVFTQSLQEALRAMLLENERWLSPLGDEVRSADAIADTTGGLGNRPDKKPAQGKRGNFAANPGLKFNARLHQQISGFTFAHAQIATAGSVIMFIKYVVQVQS
ncbi:Uncharacterised protein [Serratia ficaria]|nr:Uncharacterised protein [Serratia ficaria]